MALRALLLYLSYLIQNEELWIRHFTSNSNASIANVQGKFAEAAEKAVKFCRMKSFSNSAISELEKYFETFNIIQVWGL